MPALLVSTPIWRLCFIGRSGSLTHHPVGVGQRQPSMVNDGVDAPSTSDGVDFSYLAFSHHRSGSTQGERDGGEELWWQQW